MIYNNISELVGNTPMIRLSNLENSYNLQANLFGKAEFYNPLFSIKDRPALSMLERALEDNEISDDTVFLEATSGNMGISLAALCASKGLSLTILMPENMSIERIKLMKHFGANVILTPKSEGMQGAISKANELATSNKNMILLKQFENPANPEAHIYGTAVEILEDMDANIDALVLGIGTAGTLKGLTSVLKKVNPKLFVMGVEPKSSAVLNGQPAGAHQIQGIGAGFVPTFFAPDMVSEVFDVADTDAIEMAKIVAKLEGLPIGISSGAAVFAATNLAQRKEMKNKNIVIILPSSTERYLSMGVFD